MDEFDDFYAYGDDSSHDMMADFDYYMNTGELSDCFEEEEEIEEEDYQQEASIVYDLSLNTNLCHLVLIDNEDAIKYRTIMLLGKYRCLTVRDILELDLSDFKNFEGVDKETIDDVRKFKNTYRFLLP